MTVWHHSRCSRAIIIAVVLLCLKPSLSSSSFLIDDLDEFVEEFSECRDVETLSLAVVKDGQTLVAKGYGYVTDDKPATNRTLFLIASLTKAFTATLLGELLKENGLSYDTPIHQILPDVRFSSDYVTKHVTVRDLLSHRTGIPRYDWLWLADAMDVSQITRKISKMTSKGFREKAIYNNNMYALAGVVAEKLGGAPWEDLVTRRLLRPLGMNETTFWKRGKQVEDFAQGYRQHPRYSQKGTDPVMQVLTNISPAIAMLSSAADMARWMHFLLKPLRHLEDIVAETQAPSAIVLEDWSIWTNQIKRPEAEEPNIYDKYGLAWFLGSYRTYKTVMHYGSYIGSYSHITVMPEKGIGIFSSNTGGSQTTSYAINSILHTHILDMLLGHEPWMTSQRACEFAMDTGAGQFDVSQTDEDETHSLERPLEDYVGVYYHPVFGFCNITQDGSTIRFKYGIMEWEMSYSGQESFTGTLTNKDWGAWLLPVNFHIRENSIESVKVPFEDMVEFVKVPEHVDFKTWIRKQDSENSTDKQTDLCSHARTINKRTDAYIYMLFITFLSLMIRIFNSCSLTSVPSC